jgi:MinD superfamily P-loop ATPase
MIRVAVISGKGGTGKTMITAALAHLLPKSLLLADCDVDAANLGILLAPKRIWMRPFYGMKTAVIDPALCTECGECDSHCRFHAIVGDGQGYRINPVRCEGSVSRSVPLPRSAWNPVYVERSACPRHRWETSPMHGSSPVRGTQACWYMR